MYFQHEHIPHSGQIQQLCLPFSEGGEALEQVAQRGCGCPLPGSVQGQVGWGFEQPDLVEGIPAHGRRAGTR